jgi:nitrite reductase (NADH) small subunit
MSQRRIRVAALTELSARHGRKVVVDGEDIALWLIDRNVYALGNVCAHQHVSALHQGPVQDLEVTCPMHGWVYSLVSGHAVEGSGKVRVYRADVEKGEVFLVIDDAEGAH